MHRRLSVVLPILVATCVAPGCTTGTTSTGTAYRVKFDREMVAHVDAPIDTVHGIAREILEEEFLYAITADELDAREGIIKARTARNRLVRVETYTSGDSITKLEIYVSPFGDEAAELDILRRIEDRVGG